MVPAPGLATCCADQLVGLAGEEGDLFGALAESCRRAVRKAKAWGVEFEGGSGDGCIDDYYSLAKLAAKRTGESLPPAAYYEEIWRRFSASGECAVLFARRENRRVAAQMLIVCKGAANFLAGVSDPEYLPMRVNDFLHWPAMLWARKAGCTVYRLGPAFPGLPAEWPIARVSRFKTKFGGRAATVIQGSLFRHPHKYRAGGESHVAALCNAGTEAGALQELQD